ncbi:hypothetical protein DFJ73DRAFT_776265 [Zopfochytrium polystomum]|nr:hypothetical protein DFJ73DRAFT_776265 [Zopfochytrium polystomum]
MRLAAAPTSASRTPDLGFRGAPLVLVSVEVVVRATDLAPVNPGSLGDGERRSAAESIEPYAAPAHTGFSYTFTVSTFPVMVRHAPGVDLPVAGGVSADVNGADKN